MPWVKLDDQFTDHPKVVQAGPLAGWLYVCGLAYCARQLTDGFIPAGQLRRLLPSATVGKLAQRLVEVRLWEPTPGGFRVHDYLAYNPTRQQTLALREQKASAGRRGGKQRASRVPSTPEAECLASASAPVPVPQPVPHEASSRTERIPPEETARAPEPIERVRALAVPKPGLAPGSPHLALQRALASALNCAEPTTKSERGRWAAAIAEMLHASPPVAQAEIPRLVAVYQERNSVPCTPQGIVNQLEQLRGQQAGPRPLVANGKPSNLARNAEIFRSLTAPGASQ